jgi:hypothetical protein
METQGSLSDHDASQLSGGEFNRSTQHYSLEHSSRGAGAKRTCQLERAAQLMTQSGASPPSFTALRKDHSITSPAIASTPDY